MTTEKDGPFKATDSDYPDRANKWISIEKANARLREIMKDAPRLDLTQRNGELCVFTESLRLPRTHTCQIAPWTIKEIGK